MAKVMFVVAATMALMNACFQIGSAAIGHSDCILIMGGAPYATVDKLPIEYYHPVDGVECNHSHILPNFTLTRKQTPKDTSGCYLTDPQMIVVREGRRHSNKSTVFLLQNGTTEEVRAAFSVGVVVDSSSVSVDSSRCLSCGGFKLPHHSFNIEQCYQFDATKNKWSAHTNLPSPVSAAAFVSLGEHFYLVGGRTNGLVSADTPTTNLYVLNNAGAWKQKRSMAYARTGHSAAPLSDDEFIVCGGHCARGCHSDSCEIYNTTSNTWRTGGNMISERRYFTMINFNDQIYAIGGINGSTPTKTVEVYDKTNDSWSKVKSLKFGRNSFVAFAVTLPTPPPTTTLTTTHLTSTPQTPYKVPETTSDYPTAGPINTTKTTTATTADNTPATTTDTTVDKMTTTTTDTTPATTTAADDFDVRIIWIIILTVVGTILIILAFLILCISWKKGYFNKRSKSNEKKHQPTPFDWDDEHGSKIPRDPKKKTEELTDSQMTTTDDADSQMTTTTDDEKSMRSVVTDDGVTEETETATTNR